MHKDYLKNFHALFYQDLFNAVKQKHIPYSTKNYQKEHIIALSGDECRQIGILIKGEIRIEQLFNNGKKNIINILKQFDIFGEILVFSNEAIYPFDIISATKAEVFFISKENLLKIFTDETSLLTQFLTHVASSYLTLNQIIKLKSQKTIESKLAYYFLHIKKITADKRKCTIKNKTYLADLIGVERQSLSRVFKDLQSKDYLSYDKNLIIIKDFYYFQKLIE